jgi:hypothetical protein
MIDGNLAMGNPVAIIRDHGTAFPSADRKSQ